MTLNEIREAVSNNQTVHWMHDGYEVTKDKLEQYHVVCKANESAVRLDSLDGVLQGNESDFFIAK
ncbi:hypothetical protein LMH73_023170 [Vibrio splendidus]|nr:hypothetical protein [Vibrio splendidus]MCC4883221.1 hypothetical protein [Vibrio splendidus]